MKNELKPCPFCGSGRAERQKATNIDGTFHSWKIWCARCNCRTGPHKTLKSAERAWNRRIERLEEDQLQVVKRIEELEAKLAAYENWKNWTRPYDCDGKLINEHALYIPKLKLDLKSDQRR